MVNRTLEGGVLKGMFYAVLGVSLTVYSMNHPYVGWDLLSTWLVELLKAVFIKG